MFSVYILYSFSRSKFYVGQTNDIDDRLYRHNSGQNTSTKGGVPWKLIYTMQFESRIEAVQLETKIKKRGIRRYLFNRDVVNKCEGQSNSCYIENFTNFIYNYKLDGMKLGFVLFKAVEDAQGNITNWQKL